MDKYIKANIVFSKFSIGYMALKKDLPIRPSEMGLLNIIVLREERFTPAMIAELMEVSKPMITAHVRSLVKKGYVYKELSSEDKRSFYVLPTDKAVALVQQTVLKMNGTFRKIKDKIGTETFNELVQLLHETNAVIRDIRND